MEREAVSDPTAEERALICCGGGDGGGGGGGDLHPFIRGLLETLPEPSTAWPIHDQVKWLETAASIFSLIYEGDDVQIEIAAMREE
jgi:hypothetical protein